MGQMARLWGPSLREYVTMQAMAQPGGAIERSPLHDEQLAREVARLLG